LNDVTVWWKKNATTQELIEVTDISTSASTVRIQITVGGMYVVQNKVNVSIVAGICLGIFVFLALCLALYWKVRVQPLGGWKGWLRENRKPHLIERAQTPADDPAQQQLVQKATKDLQPQVLFNTTTLASGKKKLFYSFLITILCFFFCYPTLEGSPFRQTHIPHCIIIIN
jgi:hypothetical protein